MDEANRKLNAAFADIFRRMERDNLEREEEAAKRNPKAHKLSRVFAKGNRYVYTPAGKSARGATVRFCRSTQRNVAGYFVCWREVETPVKRKRPAKVGDLMSTTKRDQWTGFRSKKAAIALCRRRAAAFRKGQEARQRARRDA